VTDPRPRPAFAHASEAELARILDFYEVAWAYEPHTFPILYDRDGAVLESFSPDFYLPELDLYVEITTLRQSLVRKKNRKLRRLRELYPGIRIKLLYARDFRALLLKYGRIALADGLSGAEGQATPPRGICGSGLIALLAELFITGVIDKGGNFNLSLATSTPQKPSPQSRRIRPGEHGPEYVVAWAAETAHGRDIVITKVDIDNLMRASSASLAWAKRGVGVKRVAAPDGRRAGGDRPRSRGAGHGHR
jgi:hypothetical protein